MERKRSLLRSGILTAFLFLVAVALLLGGSIGGARAVFSTQSEDLITEIQLKNIGLVIVEGKTELEEDGELLTNLLGEGESFKVGKKYDEKLSVTNKGTIDEYVRVEVYRYWIDSQGNKVQFVKGKDGRTIYLNPEAIILKLEEETGDDDPKWIVDEKSSTKERTILYYSKPLAPNENSNAFYDKLMVDADIVNSEKIVDEVWDDTHTHRVITTEYIYNGYQFAIEVFADGVQTHSAEKAILSAWGVHVNIGADGTLSLA